MRSPLKNASPSPIRLEREMRERREIATGADRTLLRDQRDDAAIQHRHEQLDHFQPNPAEPERENVRPEQHHRAHFRLTERPADAAGMAADEIHLQLLAFLGRNMDVGELPESGADAVDHFAAARRFPRLRGAKRESPHASPERSQLLRPRRRRARFPKGKEAGRRGVTPG